MATPGNFRCDRCGSDVSSLRLVVREAVWYLLDVTDEGTYPYQPESEQPVLQLACVDCGYEESLRPDLRALLRLE